jgi:DnaJ family protein B protein 4
MQTFSVPDVWVQLHLTLEEISTGCTKLKSFQRPIWVNNKPVQIIDEITITIPPGIQNDATLRFKEKGEKQSNHTGDLVVQIKQIPHSIYTRQGNHLLMTKHITLKKALTGLRFSITTLDNRKLKQNIDNVIDTEYIHVVRGAGINGGDIRVNFIIMFPELSNEQRDQVGKVLENDFKRPTSHILSNTVNRIRNLF